MPVKRKCAPSLEAQRRNPSYWLDGYCNNFLGFGARVRRREALKMAAASFGAIAVLYSVLLAAALVARWLA